MTQYHNDLIEIEILEGNLLLIITGIMSRIALYAINIAHLKDLTEGLKILPINCVLLDTIKHHKDL